VDRCEDGTRTGTRPPPPPPPQAGGAPLPDMGGVAALGVRMSAGRPLGTVGSLKVVFFGRVFRRPFEPALLSRPAPGESGWGGTGVWVWVCWVRRLYF